MVSLHRVITRHMIGTNCIYTHQYKKQHHGYGYGSGSVCNREPLPSRHGLGTKRACTGTNYAYVGMARRGLGTTRHKHPLYTYTYDNAHVREPRGLNTPVTNGGCEVRVHL